MEKKKVDNKKITLKKKWFVTKLGED